MVFLDTSVLIASLSECGSHGEMYEALVDAGVRFAISALVLYEWQRGARTPAELEVQRRLLPDAFAVPFTFREAALSARLYRTLPRARTRTIDLGIAACAITHEAMLWTLNREDFADIPGLELFDPGE